MGDKLLSIPYFDDFDFQWTVFSKNAPKFWHSIPNQAELLEHFYGHFHKPQLFKWGHTNHAELLIVNFDDATHLSIRQESSYPLVHIILNTHLE